MKRPGQIFVWVYPCRLLLLLLKLTLWAASHILMVVSSLAEANTSFEGCAANPHSSPSPWPWAMFVTVLFFSSISNISLSFVPIRILPWDTNKWRNYEYYAHTHTHTHSDITFHSYNTNTPLFGWHKKSAYINFSPLLSKIITERKSYND